MARHDVQATGSRTRTARSTVADLLRDRADDDSLGLQYGDQRWSWRHVYAESAQRALATLSITTPGPPHIGVLLDNVPEYLFWVGAAALARATVVGINPTRRGEELARDVRATDCRAIVTDAAGAELLAGLDLGIGRDRLLRVDDDAYRRTLESVAGGHSPSAAAQLGRADDPTPAVASDDLLLLLFTSGTTGPPKAVRCTQGRLADIAHRTRIGYDFSASDVCYCPMPLFHGNAVMALWAPALAAGASVALGGPFSASRFLSDVRRYGATRFTYVGKALAYILATPEQPDDDDNPLTRGFGTEASASDRARFERRFGCRLVEGYGSSEGGATINRTPGTPDDAMGTARAGDDVAVCDPGTAAERPRVRFDDAGRIVNADEAIGEIVNRSGSGGFEGYYRDPEADAERRRNGWYWTGDLAYRDAQGFFYFAGRRGDWLRVDSENFAAAPIERIVERHRDVAAAAVYAVPDVSSGDQVMAAVEMPAGATFDPSGFAAFLGAQADLGTKWAPRFVRVSAALPLTGSGKITKVALAREGWRCSDAVYWRRDPRDREYVALTEDDRVALEGELARQGRLHLLAADGTPVPGRRA